jgi:hypothetical protein
VTTLRFSAVIEGLDCCDQLVSTMGQVFGLLATNGAAQLRGTNHVTPVSRWIFADDTRGWVAPPLEPESEVFEL